MSKAQDAIVTIIREAVRSNRWENEDAPGSAHIRDLLDYPGASAELNQLDEPVKELYRGIANEIEWSMNDDWMPEKMFSLPLPEARCFLRDIWPVIEELGLTQAVPKIKECHAQYRESL
ncbi:hypothetical protein [Marinobacter sp.]|uniref:hypothetical protein n=1 Tax=Marinobacter sp. TaxID=50741 RepID=UPI00258B9490|nr:hypothetical protein [Marinobacter sp.]MCW9009643.1 hypothetical protein [Marinobacter sp.]